MGVFAVQYEVVPRYTPPAAARHEAEGTREGRMRQACGPEQIEWGQGSRASLEG